MFVNYLTDLITGLLTPDLPASPSSTLPNTAVQYDIGLCQIIYVYLVFQGIAAQNQRTPRVEEREALAKELQNNLKVSKDKTPTGTPSGASAGASAGTSTASSTVTSLASPAGGKF